MANGTIKPSWFDRFRHHGRTVTVDPEVFKEHGEAEFIEKAFRF